MVVNQFNRKNAHKKQNKPSNAGTQNSTGNTPESPNSNFSKNDAPPNRNPLDEPEQILLDFFLDAAKRLWQQLKIVSSFIMNEMGGYVIFDKIAGWCINNPRVAIVLFAAGIVISMPFFILMGFGVATIVMTLTGFLVFEGTLLTIVSMLMFGCLGCLAILIFLLGVMVMAVYFGFTHLYDFYGSDGKSNAATVEKETPIDNNQNNDKDLSDIEQYESQYVEVLAH